MISLCRAARQCAGSARIAGWTMDSLVERSTGAWNMKMTAAVMYEQGRPKPYVDSVPFQIEEIDLEGPGEGEVLVEVMAAGLCHSDLSQVAGLRKRKLPVVGGHEVAGIVREIGSGVTELKPGDHVVMTVESGCGCCRASDRLRPALCTRVTGRRTQGL